MATPRRTPRTPSIFRIRNSSIRTPPAHKKARAIDDIQKTLTELLNLTRSQAGLGQMSTPSNNTQKPVTRSNKKKAAALVVDLVDLSGSPTLRGKKRANSGEVDPQEPLPKKMAEDKILDAIKNVNTVSMLWTTG